MHPRWLEGVGLGDWSDVRLHAGHVLALMRRHMTFLINRRYASTIGFSDGAGREVLKIALTVWLVV